MMAETTARNLGSRALACLLGLVLVTGGAIQGAEGEIDLGGVREEHVMIPMRDGVRLSAYLYFPEGKGPWPVLFEQRYADLKGVGTRQAFARLAKPGYVVCGVNFRGAGLSEGTWVGYRALGWGELKDGYDVCEWLGTQTWSTGKVGTFGSSQAGYAQNFLAITQPPHLAAQYMIDTGLSLYQEGYRIGGTTRPERFKNMGAVCRVPAHNHDLMVEWFQHPTYDAYWQDEDCSLHFEQHLIRWMDHYLKGVDNGVDRDAPVRYYVMGALGETGAPGNVWREAEDWPIPSRSRSYYLHAGGKLNETRPAVADSRTAFKADPKNPNKMTATVAFPGAADAQKFEAEPEVRTFTTEVLTEPVEWTGEIQADLWVTSTARDTDFIVRVSDVYPDGRSITLVDYVRRARYREGFEKEVLMEPGKVTNVAFDVGWISQVFNKGHRIRVTVCSTGVAFYEPNPNTGGPFGFDMPADAVVAENTVEHNQKHASRIVAPIPRRPVQ